MNSEQCLNMKICPKLQESSKERHDILQLVYSDAAATQNIVYNWFRPLRHGWKSLEHDEKLERHSVVSLDLHRLLQPKFASKSA